MAVSQRKRPSVAISIKSSLSHTQPQTRAQRTALRGTMSSSSELRVSGAFSSGLQLLLLLAVIQGELAKALLHTLI